MLWECSGNTLGGKHRSTLGVLWDVGIACHIVGIRQEYHKNTPALGTYSMGMLKEQHGKSMAKSEE